MAIMAEKLRRIRVIKQQITDSEIRLSRLRDDFRLAIIEAWKAGAAMQEIGDAAGLSRQRISQIIDHNKA